MNYFLIFLFKILENTIATLRLIVVSNGMKVLGSILLLITSIVWIISSSIAITNLNIYMIASFSIGSFIGSYFGSFIEEKIALGNNLIFCITSNMVCDKLRKMGYIITKIDGEGMENKKEILFIIIKRSQTKNIIREIKNIDNDAIIISEYTNILK